jgi:hypothetical protein
MGKEAYLPVPVPRVGVSYKAMVCPELPFVYIGLGRSLAFTAAYR